MSTTGVRKRKAASDGDDRAGQHHRLATGGATSRKSWVILLCQTLLLVLLVCIVLVLIFVPAPIDPVSFVLPPPPKLEGVLAPNNLLAKSHRILENQVIGPESIAIQKGVIYTGTMDGKIVVIENGVPRTLATLGKPPCGGYDNEPTCGRPLGMRFDNDGYLVVADAYLGLFKLNVATGDIHKLYDSKTKVEGQSSTFLNDLDIDSQGQIYLTDSSAKWDRRSHRFSSLESSGDGRLMKFDPKTKKMEVLSKGLYFANGVQLSKPEDYLLLTESTRARVLKFNLKGDKYGTIEIFADNLPGLPDNIRRSSSGGYWVALAKVRHQDAFSLFDYTSGRPWIRSLITKVVGLDTITALTASGTGMIVELDRAGKVVRMLQDPTGETIPTVSEVEDDGGVLYLGSYHSPFMGKLDLRLHKAA